MGQPLCDCRKERKKRATEDRVPFVLSQHGCRLEIKRVPQEFFGSIWSFLTNGALQDVEIVLPLGFIQAQRII